MSLVSERPRSGPPHYNGVQYKDTKQLPKIKLDSAMRDFQAMFPGLTPMVIEAVLRANGGAVDPTVEKLISMCREQQQKEKEKEFLQESDLLPGYYEVCCKEQPPPSYHASQIYTDASTQTEQSLESGRKDDSTTLVNDRISSDNVERVCVTPLSSGSNSSSSVNSSNSCVREDDDEKVALYLQNKELLQQLRQKQRIIEYLERNSKSCGGVHVEWLVYHGDVSTVSGCREQSNGTKPNRYSDRKLYIF